MNGGNVLTQVSSIPRLRSTRVVINPTWCKKCGICIAFCNKGVLAYGEGNKVEIVNSEKCVGCGLCENFCPDYAISLEVADFE